MAGVLFAPLTGMPTAHALRLPAAASASSEPICHDVPPQSTKRVPLGSISSNGVHQRSALQQHKQQHGCASAPQVQPAALSDAELRARVVPLFSKGRDERSAQTVCEATGLSVLELRRRLSQMDVLYMDRGMGSYRDCFVYVAADATPVVHVRACEL